MAIVTDELELSTRGDSEVLDITERVAAVVVQHGFREGSALVFVPGSTAALTTVEFEPRLVQDLSAFFERILLRRARYHHEDTWHDGNGHSHVRSGRR